MSVFIRILVDRDKEDSLRSCSQDFRASRDNDKVFTLDSQEFSLIPTAPFAYWSSPMARHSFNSFPAMNSDGRTACVTNPAGDDQRYYRLWWEVQSDSAGRGNNCEWKSLSKGGDYSSFYFDLHLVVLWNTGSSSYHGFLGTKHRPLSRPASLEYFFRPGLTWPRRTASGFGVRALPRDSIFADKSPGIFLDSDNEEELLAILALTTSSAFKYLVSLQMAVGSYEVGVIQRSPVPQFEERCKQALAKLANEAWKIKYRLDSFEETSHSFHLPLVMHGEEAIDECLSEIERFEKIGKEIDDLIFPMYGFCINDSEEASNLLRFAEARDSELEKMTANLNKQSRVFALLSWCIGVCFGRFCSDSVTKGLDKIALPGPFDVLPSVSPGMICSEERRLIDHRGILVDDPGHSHDLPQLIQTVLEQVEMPDGDDTRAFLRRQFFQEHLKQYTKSRRKAPIYWPLSTSSGTYTLWIYYPDLDDQTLYTVVNDFLEPKLKSVEDMLNTLRSKSSRTGVEERDFVKQQDLQQELIELRDTILEIAPNYKPNHDDGVQITAAPLWPLFRHKPWQKILKDTWEKLEAGEYDWAHLAHSYWPDRVREKCKTDKSLAIAHGLEELYEDPSA